jgi:adenylate cyclase
MGEASEPRVPATRIPFQNSRPTRCLPEGRFDTKALVPALLERLAKLGSLPDDPPEERLRKAILVLAGALTAVLATIWIVMYLLLGIPRAALGPAGYQVGSAIAFAHFLKTRRYRVYRFTQLFLMLILPFLMQVSLGGFHPASAVVIWSFVAPMGALVLYGPRRALAWFLAFLAMIATAGILDGLGVVEPASIGAEVRILLFTLNVLGLAFTTYVLLQYFVRQRDRALTALEAEQQRSERLLLNVLPQPIAERLKEKEEVIADAFDEVTVLFADLVNFTGLTDRLAPDDMIRLLNDVFSRFDALAERYEVEKIRTIGDAYFAACGLPIERDGHAEAIADMALDMCRAVSDVSQEYGENLGIRVGIDTGPVVAGIIGRRKFMYDLWGDIVNTASRMESHGVPGKIQITERTFEHLNGRYLMTERGEVPVKGKGPMKTYFLEGRLTGRAAAGA